MPSPSPSPSAVIDYRFRQRFRVPARRAYDWATGFSESDWTIAGIDGERQVVRISPTQVRLTDRIRASGEPGATKVRMVQLYPDELSWVSTHIEGPCLHSQFRYSISADSPRASHLTFRGRELRWEARRSDPARVERLRASLKDEDARLWRSFAKAMELDLASGDRRA
jgi:hypothetical protein